MRVLVFPPDCTFQSTPSAWRETVLYPETLGNARHFNPLPPHGGRPTFAPLVQIALSFQSTPSAWRETRCCLATEWTHGISIHSLRMEGDFVQFFLFATDGHFNPLPPHGGRPSCFGLFSFDRGFQSTPSAWRETQIITSATQNMDISIHSLRMEGDAKKERRNIAREIISIHSLRMEGDAAARPRALAGGYFNPLPPHGGRPQN